MSKQESQSYKSPLRKLVKFFEQSRDQWKNKYLKKKAEVKALKNRVNYLERTKMEWKQKAQQLKANLKQKEVKKNLTKTNLKKSKKKVMERSSVTIKPKEFEMIPFHHQYSVGQIMLFISFVLNAASSLRGATRNLKVINQFWGGNVNVPSWHSARLWLLRLGYYKLTRPKTLTNDWVWIVDHTVQMGAEKVLLILGIRLEELPEGKSLSHEDVEAITLSPVTRSNGKRVYEQLKQSIEKTGVPRAIVGDYGSDLKAGIKRFCQSYPKTSYIYDIKHKTANLLKHQLQTDPAWEKFTRLATQTKKQLQQTSNAPHAPPNQRSKARYMNVDKLIKWGNVQLKFLNQADEKPEQLLDKLSWLWDYQEHLEQWNEIIHQVTEVESFIRKQGLTQQSHHDLSKLLPEISKKFPKAQQIRADLLDFISEQSAKVKPGERLLASSEIIESVFGKQKRLEQEQVKSGFTGLLLGIAAMVSTTTSEIVKKAMETVPTQAVLDWYQENLNSSVQAKKMEMHSHIRNKNGITF